MKYFLRRLVSLPERHEAGVAVPYVAEPSDSAVMQFAMADALSDECSFQLGKYEWTYDQRGASTDLEACLDSLAETSWRLDLQLQRLEFA